MKKRFIIIFYLFSFFLLQSCTDDNTIQDKEKFAKVYVDLLINEEQNRNDSLKINSGKEIIFKRYGVTQKQYEATIEYYNQNPERWKEFFDDVNNYYNQIEKKPKSR